MITDIYGIQVVHAEEFSDDVLRDSHSKIELSLFRCGSGHSYIVYDIDLEERQAVSSVSVEKLAGIKYSGGWREGFAVA